MPQALTDKETISGPKHIAIIMDGNGRWAKSRGLPRAVGHQKGAAAIHDVVEGCLDYGVKVLTLYAFSSENWSRPITEVSDLMGLLKLYIKKEVAQLSKRGVSLRFIGRRDRLSKDIIDLIDSAEERTKLNTKLTLVIAVNYGGQAEIIDAVKAIAKDIEKGDLAADDIDEDMLSAALYTAEWGNPDLIIRTSGEQRLSNFMLWQAAYSEFLFMDLLWPDFSEQSLKEAIEVYQNRERRFGARL